jgi:V8-like Glu-specific endopeptidase
MQHNLSRALTLAAVVALPACVAEFAGDGEHIESRESAIVNGIATYELPAIGRLHLGSAKCTANLVSQNVIITAAHCVNYASCTQGPCPTSQN